MTIHQFNTLKWIYSEGGISEKQLRKCHQGNIGSLAKNRWLEKSNRYILVSQRGYEALERYKHRLQRRNEADVTDRVKNLLHLGRILQMQGKAA